MCYTFHSMLCPANYYFNSYSFLSAKLCVGMQGLHAWERVLPSTWRPWLAAFPTAGNISVCWFLSKPELGAETKSLSRIRIASESRFCRIFSIPSTAGHPKPWVIRLKVVRERWLPVGSSCLVFDVDVRQTCPRHTSDPIAPITSMRTCLQIDEHGKLLQPCIKLHNLCHFHFSF